jgi:hypothetical protein
VQRAGVVKPLYLNGRAVPERVRRDNPAVYNPATLALRGDLGPGAIAIAVPRIVPAAVPVAVAAPPRSPPRAGAAAAAVADVAAAALAHLRALEAEVIALRRRPSPDVYLRTESALRDRATRAEARLVDEERVHADTDARHRAALDRVIAARASVEADLAQCVAGRTGQAEARGAAERELARCQQAVAASDARVRDLARAAVRTDAEIREYQSLLAGRAVEELASADVAAAERALRAERDAALRRAADIAGELRIERVANRARLAAVGAAERTVAYVAPTPTPTRARALVAAPTPVPTTPVSAREVAAAQLQRRLARAATAALQS